jgi:ElaB/YqjD/DUF883 family membrane-anchored ribosome-binding protein
MSNVKNTPDDVQRRRAELEAIISNRQENLSEKARRIQADVKDSFNVKKLIAKHPAAAVGISLGAGFLLGRMLFSSSKKRTAALKAASPTKPGIASKLFDAAIDTGISIATGYAASKVQEFIAKSSTSEQQEI